MDDFKEILDEIKDTEDTTALYDKSDVEKNRFMAILAYLSWLVIIPIIAAKDSPFARFHANQGLILTIAGTVCGAVIKFLVKFPLVGWIFSLAGKLLGLVWLILAIMGIVNVVNGRARELPLIGRFQLLK